MRGPVKMNRFSECISERKMRVYLHNRRVLLATFDKFVKRQACIFISIHIPEDLIHTLFTWDM
jgi:hypothetical protein